MTNPIGASKGPVSLTFACWVIELRTWSNGKEPDDHCVYLAKQRMEKSNFCKTVVIEVSRKCALLPV